MCGVAGILSVNGVSEARLRYSISLMCDAVYHRGPDSYGYWVDGQQQVALGHRRLSVVELSELGHQPMVSDCGRYVLVFNGEIYNNKELRRFIGTHSWRGQSDTETLLALIVRYGPIHCLEKLIGMFAIAVWDRMQRKLVLARDRMGEKPMYYGRVKCGHFVFGSELHAIRSHPEFDESIDVDALALYMRYGSVPGEHSIYTGIEKLSPGGWIQISPGGDISKGLYWDLSHIASSGARERKSLTDVEAVTQLEDVLRSAVSGQMNSDVPLGAFLSGGVDSSIIVALMADQGGGKTRTFSIGFSEPGYNEAEHAKAVADYLGTQHTELYVTASDALAVIPKLPYIFDEPFADSSQIPTYLVSELARASVTVALSGDGGDELFAGYNRHVIAARDWDKLARIPLALRKILSRSLLSLPPSFIDNLVAPSQRISRKLARHHNLGEKLHKFAHLVLPASGLNQMYDNLVSHWQCAADIVPSAHEYNSVRRFDELSSQLDSVDSLCLLDQLTYLPDDILVKVDRSAMSLGLETRAPMLDHRVVEYAWSLPLNQKYRSGKGKWLLRELLYRHVPKTLIDRPKQGFSIPLGQWLRGPLRQWAEELLSMEALNRTGYLNAERVRQTWDQHLSGRHNWPNLLWNVLMFQAWYAEIHQGKSRGEQRMRSPN